MPTKVLLLDMDEVLVNLLDKWIYYYNNKYGTDYTRADFGKGGRLDYGELGEDWIEFLRIPGFHADLNWLEPEVPFYVEQLEEHYEVHVVTAPVAWETPRDKYSFFHTKFVVPGILPGMKRLHLTRNKPMVRGSILVDDRPREYGGDRDRVICFNQPWNADWEGERVYSWRDLMRVLL